MPPREVSVFIDDDGTVTFTDLTEDMGRIAGKLDPSRGPEKAKPQRTETG